MNSRHVGVIPALGRAVTRARAVSGDGKTARTWAVALGRGTSFKVSSVMMPSVPSEPMTIFSRG